MKLTKPLLTLVKISKIVCIVSITCVSYYRSNDNNYYLTKNRHERRINLKQRHWGLIGLITYLVVILFLMVTNWQPFQRTTQKPIRVITSLNFYGEAAKAVAGKYGQVTSLINSAAVDPHEYQPTTAQARQLSRANVVIENGLGYDQWLSKMVKADSGNQKVISVGNQIAGKKAGANEHVWYQPQTMMNLTSALAKQYGQLDPHHREYYQAQAKKYQAKLTNLNQVIAKAKEGVSGNQKVAVSEPVFDYALQNLGYQIIDSHFEKAIEDGNDPSPTDIAQLRQAIINHQIAFFVNNSQASDTTVKNLVKLAHQNQVPVLNVTESKPDHLTYVEWITSEYQRLIKVQAEVH